MCKLSVVLKLAIVAVAILAGSNVQGQPDRGNRRSRAEPALRGKQLTDALARPVAGWSWTGRAFQQIIDRIEIESRIAIVCDRQVNPDAVVSFEASGLTVDQALHNLAATVNASSVRIGNSVYVGPPQACEYVETLIELRRVEARELPVAIRRRLAESRSISWNDLETPEEVLETIRQTFQVSFENASDIPYDLLRGDSIENATPIEAACIFLIQFGKTFEWNSQTGKLELSSVSERPVLSRRFRIIRGQGSRKISEWRETMPDLKFELRGSEIIAIGSAADLVTFEILKSTGRLPSNRNPPKPNVVPLKNRLFTLRIRDVPASALMKQLEQSGIEFKYNTAEMSKSKIDFDQFVEFQVQNASPDDFFEAVFKPIGVDFKIRGNSVELAPSN